MKKNIINLVILSIFVFFCGVMLTGCLPHHHKWSDWTEFSALTCTKDQILVRMCEKCKTSEKVIGEEATGHDFEESIVSPTQNENGYTFHRCHCGENYKDNHTCLITFERFTTNPTIDLDELPIIEQKIVDKGQLLEEIEETEEYKVVDYRIYQNPSTYTFFDMAKPINQSVKVTLVWDKLIPDTLTEEEKAFYSLTRKIQKLEKISLQYNTEKSSTKNPYVRVAQYLRQTRYGDSEWNLFGGTVEADFAEYVIANQGTFDLPALQNQASFTAASTHEEVDFIHMIAIINVVAKNGISNTTYNDMVGWGGDLCQLAKQIKELGLTGDALQDKAYELFRGKSSTFSDEDFLADIDALNIANLVINEEMSISNAMKTYYFNLTDASRKQQVLSHSFSGFIDEQSGKINKTQEEMASAIVNRLSSNFLITMWCRRNGLNISTDATIFNACANAFVKYFVD